MTIPSSAIDDLRVGDWVLSRPEHEPEAPLQPRQVVPLFCSESELVTVRMGGGSVRTTSEHPFWVVGRGWTGAIRLAAGDLLSAADGSQIRVEGLEIGLGLQQVYNVEVEGYHTYFAGSADRALAVWAHNTNSLCLRLSPSSEGGGGLPSEVPAPNSKPLIKGPVRPYNEAKKARTPGYDDHHLDPPLGRNDPNYPTGPTIRIRNDNAGGKVPGGVNLHTGAGGFQASLRHHITQDLGFSISQWNKLPDSVRIMHLKRYYASLGIPFPV